MLDGHGQVCCNNETGWDDRICGLFFKCRSYECSERDTTPPVVGAGYGDVHVWTLNQMEFDFHGSGDYWLLRTGGVSVQARLMLSQEDRGSNVSWISAVAMTCDGSRFQASHFLLRGYLAEGQKLRFSWVDTY